VAIGLINSHQFLIVNHIGEKMKKLIGGGVLIFVGGFMLLGFAVSLSKNPADMGDLIAALLFVVAPMGIGGALIRSHFKDKQKALQEKEDVVYKQREKQIIRLAQQKGGRLSIPEIAVDTSMSTEEAEKFMQELTAKGFVDMQVTDSGVIVYEFYEIAHKNELEE
jgi:hypothetical protein